MAGRTLTTTNTGAGTAEPAGPRPGSPLARGPAARWPAASAASTRATLLSLN